AMAAAMARDGAAFFGPASCPGSLAADARSGARGRKHPRRGAESGWIQPFSVEPSGFCRTLGAGLAADFAVGDSTLFASAPRGAQVPDRGGGGHHTSHHEPVYGVGGAGDRPVGARAL